MTSDDDPEATERTLALTTGGITLLGVILSIGVSVGFGLTGPWWLRVLGAAATAGALVIVVKVATRSGPHGWLARLARWIIGDTKGEDTRG